MKNKRAASHSVGIIDSQFVKCSEWGVLEKGFYSKKQVNGRKRHIVVDSLGCILAVVVHAANQHDSKGAVPLLNELFDHKYYRLVKIIGNKACHGIIKQIAAIFYDWCIQIFELPQIKKFVLINLKNN